MTLLISLTSVLRKRLRFLRMDQLTLLLDWTLSEHLMRRLGFQEYARDSLTCRVWSQNTTWYTLLLIPHFRNKTLHFTDKSITFPISLFLWTTITFELTDVDDLVNTKFFDRLHSWEVLNTLKMRKNGVVKAMFLTGMYPTFNAIMCTKTYGFVTFTKIKLRNVKSQTLFYH